MNRILFTIQIYVFIVDLYYLCKSMNENTLTIQDAYLRVTLRDFRIIVRNMLIVFPALSGLIGIVYSLINRNAWYLANFLIVGLGAVVAITLVVGGLTLLFRLPRILTPPVYSFYKEGEDFVCEKDGKRLVQAPADSVRYVFRTPPVADPREVRGAHALAVVFNLFANNHRQPYFQYGSQPAFGEKRGLGLRFTDTAGNSKMVRIPTEYFLPEDVTRLYDFVKRVIPYDKTKSKTDKMSVVDRWHSN